MKEPLRGDVFYCECDKYRPVVVVSNNTNNINSNCIVVVPITSNTKRTDLPVHVLLHQDITGVESVVMCERYITVNKEDLTDYVCTLSRFVMKKIDHAMSVQLGLVEKYV